jgi:hypothetical protein
VELPRQELDLAREEVDNRTHMFVHLKHAIEMQDLVLEERAATIATLKLQLQVLQIQEQPTPVSHPEISILKCEPFSQKKPKISNGFHYFFI